MPKNQQRILIISLTLILLCFYLFYGVTAQNMNYLLSRRIPRGVAMLIIGLGTALSTTLFQSVSQNEILTPDMLGYTSIYMCVQTALIYFLGSAHLFVYNTQLNFVISSLVVLTITMLLYPYLLRRHGNNIVYVLLIGIVISGLFQSISSTLQLMINPNEFTLIQNKFSASFGSMNLKALSMVSLIVLACYAWVRRNIPALDILRTGTTIAHNVGINTQQLTRHSFIAVSLLCASITALVGPVSFLGLITVNSARQIKTHATAKEKIITASFLGFMLLLLSQVLLERVFQFQITLSVLLDLVGGIYVIYWILKERL